MWKKWLLLSYLENKWKFAVHAEKCDLTANVRIFFFFAYGKSQFFPPRMESCHFHLQWYHSFSHMGIEEPEDCKNCIDPGHIWMCDLEMKGFIFSLRLMSHQVPKHSFDLGKVCIKPSDTGYSFKTEWPGLRACWTPTALIEEWMLHNSEMYVSKT